MKGFSLEGQTILRLSEVNRKGISGRSKEINRGRKEGTLIVVGMKVHRGEKKI